MIVRELADEIFSLIQPVLNDSTIPKDVYLELLKTVISELETRKDCVQDELVQEEMIDAIT